MENEEWISVKKAAKLLDVSERTIINRINSKDPDKKLVAIKPGNVWKVEQSSLKLGDIRKDAENTPQVSEDLEVVSRLRAELEEKNKQIEKLEAELEGSRKASEEIRKDLSEASHRHDTVVMQMSRMLEYERQPFWRRWFKQKVLPAPSDVIDMETESDES